jgi:hypothetical protein
MTGSPLAGLPALIRRPHKAQTVPPPLLFPALPFAGRSFPFCCRAIETESDFTMEMDSLVFPLARQDRANSLFTSGLSLRRLAK